jgi:hypothetical protein
MKTTTPERIRAPTMRAGKMVRPASILEARILKSDCGIDFQNSMALFRPSALKASAK